VYFYTYNQLKRSFRSLHSNSSASAHVLKSNAKSKSKVAHLHPLEHFLSGAIAGCASVLAANPIWMVKTRLQLQTMDGGPRIYNGIVQSVTRIVREEGWLAFYRGLGPALMMVSNSGIQFMVYEELRKMVVKFRGRGDDALVPSQDFLIIGAAAKLTSTVSVYPLQVLKSRLYQRGPTKLASVNAEPSSTEPSSSLRRNARYQGVRHIVSDVWQTAGWRGFYKGLWPQLLKTAPASAITLFSYETIMRLIPKVHDH
jgi:solute carrier family 25 folate transporter 32